jgi:CCR4-NOT transcription complex subunit 1
MSEVSFAAPLLWQIRFIVQNTLSNKKTSKQGISEVRRLTDLYGDDARLFLFRCLIEHVDPKSTQHGHLVQFLAEEIEAFSKKPNFGSVFCQALMGQADKKSITEDYLQQFCKQLNLKLVTQIAVGASIVGCTDEKASIEGRRFLAARTVEFGALPKEEQQKLSGSVLHEVAYYMKSAKHLKAGVISRKAVDAVDSIVVARAENSSALFPLVETRAAEMKDQSQIDETKTKALRQQQIGALGTAGPVLTELSKDFLGQLARGVSNCIADIVRDVGYASTESAESFRNVLKTAERNTLTAKDAAAIICMMGQTQSDHDDEFAPVLHGALAGEKVDDRQPAGGWNVPVLVEVIQGCIGKSIVSWDQVVSAMDMNVFQGAGDNRRKDFKSTFEFITQVYKKGSGAGIPARLFFGRWENTDVQFSFLRCALQMPDRIDWSEHGTGPNRQTVVEGSPSSNGNVMPWCSIDLVDTLMRLAQTDMYQGVQKLFEFPLGQCPDLLLTALCRLRPLWVEVKQQLLSLLFPRVLDNDGPFIAEVLKNAWGADKDNVVLAFVNYFKKGHALATVPRIIKFAERLEPDNKALHYVLEANHVAFSVEMAATASTRDVINLSKWLQNRLARSDRFGEACVDHLASKLRQRKSVDPPTSIPHATMHAFIATLENAPGRPDSPMKVKLKQLKTLAHNAIPQGSAPAGNDVGRNDTGRNEGTANHSDIEEEANAYFQKIFTAQQTILEVVEMLKRFKNSSNDREKKIFLCMVGNLMDEYRFFHKYPDKELRITGELFGNLIKENLLEKHILGTALRNVLEAVQKPPMKGHNHKMFLFGWLALQQFKDRLQEWPEYVQHLVNIPHLKATQPDWVAEISKLIPSRNAVANPKNTSSVPELPKMANLRISAQAQPRPTTIKELLGTEMAEETPHPPPSDVVDALQFVINNLSIQNMESKLKEVNEILKPEFTAWFADFLVEKRVIAQANFHKLYLLFVEKLGRQELDDEVLRISYSKARQLLRQDGIITESNDRTILKNLGNYIGIATLSRNRPVLHRDLNLKELLYLAYEEGKLIAVAPFVAKILEGAKVSNVFLPPNPWLMALVRAMRELYDVLDLKLKLKFEVEVLCKSLNLKVEDVTPAKSLPGRRKPNMRNNPDFNAKAVEKAMAEEAAAEKLKAERQSENGFSNADGGTVIPNLAKYVTINASLNLPELQGEASLQRLVPRALDLAIREIITPVAERSVTIACITTADLVAKDFAMESDENKMRKAAHLMASNLAGNLALVTCKDPLRGSMMGHLRTFILQHAGAKIPQNDLEAIVQKCVNDNLDLGCMLVVKAATEKAMRDIDARLRDDFEIRKTTREQQGQKYYDMSIFHSRNRYPSALPDVLRPQPGGLQNHQYMVYSMFQQMPRRNMPDIGKDANESQGGAPASSSAASEAPLPTVANGAPANAANQETLSSTQALERIFDCMAQLDRVIQRFGSQIAGNLDHIPPNHPVQPLIGNVARVIQITVAVDREQVVLNFAQQVVTRLFERKQDPVTVRLYMACVAAVKGFCKPLVATLTNWVVASNFMDIEIIPELVRVKLLNASDFDNYILNLMRKGDPRAVPYAKAFLKTIIIDKKITDVAQFGRTASGLQNLAMNTELYPDLQQFIVDLQAAGVVNARAKQQNMPFRIISKPNSNPAQREELTRLLMDWTVVVEKNKAETSYMQLLRVLQNRQYLKDDDSTANFFRTCTEICVERYLQEKTFNMVDSYAKLIVLLIKFSTPREQNSQLLLLNKVLLIVAQVTVWQADECTKLVQAALSAASGPATEDQSVNIASKTFDQKPYFRLFVALLEDLSVPDPALANGSSADVVLQFANTFHALRPQRIPGFAFAWMEMISHKCMVPALLSARRSRMSGAMQILVVDLLQYMGPCLRKFDLNEATGMLYKGTLRFLLVLLHDYPEFFCDYHFNFCNNIPTNCIQLRNLVLSAFPRNMRLPDPFSPNLKIDQLPTIQQPPSMISNHAKVLERYNLLKDIKPYLETRQPASFLQNVTKLVLLPPEQQVHTRFNVPVINALVLYTGAVASSSIGASVERQAAVGLFMKLLRDLDNEGRYLFLNAVANQLRYPNLHTYYFSCVLLYLFTDAKQEVKLKEQITRVLLERLIVHRPHPWGLLITFIELIKNQRYNFWTHEFTQCHPDISRLFESVAASCLQKGKNSSADSSQQKS